MRKKKKKMDVFYAYFKKHHLVFCTHKKKQTHELQTCKRHIAWFKTAAMPSKFCMSSLGVVQGAQILGDVHMCMYGARGYCSILSSEKTLLWPAGLKGACCGGLEVFNMHE